MASVTYVGTRKLAGDVLGDDLISNYHFTSGTTGWTDTSAAGGTVSVTPQGALKMVYATGRPSLTHEIATVAGTLYRVDVDTVTLGQSVSHWFGTSSGGTQLGVMTPSAVGTATGFFVATGTTSYLRINGPTSANTNVYDNVRVRPVVARGHATSINHIINGKFTVDAAWTKGTGWTINTGTGKAGCDGTQTANSALTNPTYTDAVRIGKVYDTSFAVSAYSVGTVRLNVNGSGVAEGTGRTADGTYTQQVTFAPTSSGAYSWEILADADFVGNIDDFTVFLASGNTWSQDFGIQHGTYSSDRRFSRDSATSLDRSAIVYTYDGAETFHTFTTKIQDYQAIPFMDEWLASVEDGTQFTFDLYGTTAQPQSPITVTLESAGKQPAGVVNGRPAFRYQITLREA